MQSTSECIVARGEHRRGQKGSVCGTRIAYRQSADGHAFGHLRDREERIDPVQRAAAHGNPEDGKQGLGRRHARQMGRATSARDDDLDAAAFCLLTEAEEQVGCPVCRDDLRLVWDAELAQDLSRVLHRRPIARAAHDQGNEGCSGWLRLGRVHRALFHSRSSFRVFYIVHLSSCKPDGSTFFEGGRLPRDLTQEIPIVYSREEGQRVAKARTKEQPPEAAWTFLTNHSHVLLCLVQYPESRMRDVADKVGITERAVQRIVSELEAAGYVTRTREGRRNTYEVNGALPLRHAVEGHQTLNSLIKLILEDRGS